MSTTATSGTTNPEITSLIAGIGSADDVIREQARTKLVEMGAAAVPALIDALNQGAEFRRWEGDRRPCALRPAVRRRRRSGRPPHPRRRRESS